MTNLTSQKSPLLPNAWAISSPQSQPQFVATNFQEFATLEQARLFRSLKSDQFSGELVLQDAQGRESTIYFYLGRIIYGTGGVHSGRRWQRSMTQYCPDKGITMQTLLREAIAANHPISWEYYLLERCFHEGKVTRIIMLKIIEEIMTELLFDLMQSPRVSYVLRPCQISASSIILLDSDLLVVKAWKLWQAWQNSKLADRSPNQAPIIKNSVVLKQRTSVQTYQILSRYLDGNRSLRDIAIQLNQDVLQVTRSLLLYIQLGLVQLVDIDDFPKCLTSLKKEQGSVNRGKLIACVDQSSVLFQQLENIIKPRGYDFISSQEDSQAISLFLNRKPDLIFVDAQMHTQGGTKVYQQIRQVSALRKVPMVLLSQHSGMINRLQAKIEGYSDFLTKPLKVQQVLETMAKHLA